MENQTSQRNALQTQFVDTLRAMQQSAVARYFIGLIQGEESAAPGINQRIVEQALHGMEKLEREIKRATRGKCEKIYLERSLRDEKLTDIGGVIDLVARIGLEENTEIYEEFMGLLLDLLHSVMYSQKNRRKMHFGKYKALFQLIAEELKRDVNQETPQIIFRNGQLYFCSNVVGEKTSIKQP